MKKHVLIVFAVFLAGCTLQPGGNADRGDRTKVTGLEVVGLSYDRGRVYEGENVTLTLEVANTNPTPIKSFTALPISVGRDTKIFGEAGVNDTGFCVYDRIPEAKDYGPTVRQCIWNLEAGISADVEETTLPVTVVMAYTSNLSMEGPKLGIRADRNLAPGETKKTTEKFGNTELQLTVTYPSVVEAGTGRQELELDLEVSNVGRGDLVNRTVGLYYRGSIFNAVEFKDRSSCTGLRFLRGEDSAEMTCVLEEKNGNSLEDDTNYNLEVRPSYRYRRNLEAPLEVVRKR